MNVYFHFVIKLRIVCNKLTIINKWHSAMAVVGSTLPVYTTDNLISSTE